MTLKLLQCLLFQKQSLVQAYQTSMILYLQNEILCSPITYNINKELMNWSSNSHQPNYNSQKLGYVHQTSKIYNNIPRREDTQESLTEIYVQSEAEPAFEARNYVYELQSKCNSLEYQKTKSEIAFQNIISELKQKNAYLEELASELSEKNQDLTEQRDEIRLILSQVRQKNHELSKQIQAFKLQMKQLESFRLQSYDQDRPSFQLKNKTSLSRNNLSDSQCGRTENIHDNSTQPSESVYSLKKQIYILEKQLKSLKIDLEKTGKNEDTVKLLEQEKEELIKKITEKDYAMNRLKQKKDELQAQYKKYKQGVQSKQKKVQTVNSQEIKRLNELISVKDTYLQNIQSQKCHLEGKITELTVELGRVKSQKNGIEQYNKYLQSCNTQNQAKKKILQQDIYKYQREISQLRAQLFNQRLENKKNMSNLRLSFQQQKIKHIESLDEKSKEILKFREITLSSQRQNNDIDDISQKNSQLLSENQRLLQQNSSIKNQNEGLKQDLKKYQEKYDKKNDKLNNLQKELRQSYDKRIKLLEGQLCKLQIENENKTNVQMHKPQHNANINFFNEFECNDDENQMKDVIEILKIQKQQKQQQIKVIKDRERKLLQKCKKYQQKLQNIDFQLQSSRNKGIYYRKQQASQKIKAYQQLQSQIHRLNEEISKQRQRNDHLNKQNSLLQHKSTFQIKMIQEQNDRMKKQISSMQESSTQNQKRIVQAEQQVKVKDKEIYRVMIELEAIKMQKQGLKKNIYNIQKLYESTKDISQKQQSRIKILQKELQESKSTTLRRQQQLQAQYQHLRRQKQDATLLIKNNVKSNIQSNDLLKNIQQLQRQNYQLRLDYSDSLQEVNKILINYKQLEEKYKKLSVKYQQSKKQSQNFDYSKRNGQLLTAQIQEYKATISQHEKEIQSLNRRLKQQRQQKHRSNKSSKSPHYHPLKLSKDHPIFPKQNQLWLSSSYIETSKQNYPNPQTKRQEYSNNHNSRLYKY